ncbi:cysteine hydrolase family protein [Photobacterium alginatilyticum]|uniref:Cysteine hydrolase n=1 Tax=Photobacterium alginatilyticum TaxID=1775171 RepID=A0ABW9YG17_9GAMM|nr:cysteine hydrolase family protein [Photobacterium alginatilyticum]NBI52526.1 cysteine hydrolase [Photobacterium alginatilyticum]
MTQHAGKALIIIDPQNDYFPEGKYPLWNTELILTNIKKAIGRARQQDIAVILVQHIANSEIGIAPFFNEGTEGAAIHPEITAAAPAATIVTKSFADSFEQTCLEHVLKEQGITELLLCGMMTQNCVTHTAISRQAEKYTVSVLADCCTTVDEMIHNIALNAMSTRVRLLTMD